MRPSLDPNRFDMEADQKADAARAWRGHLVIIVVAVAVLTLRFLAFPPTPPPANAKDVGWKSWDDATAHLGNKQSDKPTLVLFTADWCGACYAFETKVLARPDIAQHLASRYTLLTVDMSRRDSPNQALGKQYKIEVYPTLILYNSSGGEVARCYGLSAPELMLWLKTDGEAIKQYIE